MRTYLFCGKIADSFDFDITNSHLISRGVHGHETIKIPMCLTAQQGPKIKYKIIINTLHLLQIGNFAAQISLQDCEVMSSCRCIKCNLTKAEWKPPNHQGRLLTLENPQKNI